MTPTPDAGRVRRWLSRALVVSGGAVAATALAWGVSSGSASAADDPFGGFSFGGGDQSVTSEAGDSADRPETDKPDPLKPGNVESGKAEPGKAMHGLAKAAERTFDHERFSEPESPQCENAEEGADEAEPADVDGQLGDTDGTDLENAEGSEDAENAEDSCEAGNEPADTADETDAQGSAQDSTRDEQFGASEGAKLHAAHQEAKRAWNTHVAEPARDAVHDLGQVLRVLPGFGDGPGVDSPDFDLPWHVTPGADDLPSAELPVDSGDGAHGGHQTAANDADARAPGDGRPGEAASTSDDGNPMTSGAERAGHGDLGDHVTDDASADADHHSGEPTNPFGPENDRPAPAPMPAQTTTHVAGAHADAPTGAVLAATDPFAASAVGATVRPGHSLSSMSPGSQPGVTPD